MKNQHDETLGGKPSRSLNNYFQISATGFFCTETGLTAKIAPIRFPRKHAAAAALCKRAKIKIQDGGCCATLDKHLM